MESRSPLRWINRRELSTGPLMEAWERLKELKGMARCPEMSKSGTPLSSRWLEEQGRGNDED